MPFQLFPPFRFRCVEDGIYAGAYPTLPNMRFLKRLQLKTLVSLVPEPPVHDLQEFCSQENIDMKHIRVPKFKDCVQLDEDQLAHLLSMMIDARRFPMYIHCLDGSNVCSHVVMCLRRLQDFNSKMAVQEATRYCDELSKEDLDFVKRLKQQLMVQVPAMESAAKWIARRLYSDNWMQRHPQGIKLLFMDKDCLPYGPGFAAKEKVSGASADSTAGGTARRGRRGSHHRTESKTIREKEFYANLSHQSLPTLEFDELMMQSDDTDHMMNDDHETRHKHHLPNLSPPAMFRNGKFASQRHVQSMRYNDPMLNTRAMQALSLEIPSRSKLERLLSPLSQQLSSTLIPRTEQQQRGGDDDIVVVVDSSPTSPLGLPKSVSSAIEGSRQRHEAGQQTTQQDPYWDLLGGDLDDEILSLVLEIENLINS